MHPSSPGLARPRFKQSSRQNGQNRNLLPSTEPKIPKPRKVAKESPGRTSGPPALDPPKTSKKSLKSQEIDKINYFLDFSDVVLEVFGGSGVGGPEVLSGDFFETFRGFGILGSVDGRGDPNPTHHSKTWGGARGVSIEGGKVPTPS